MSEVTSTILETTNLNSTIEVEKDGLKQLVMTISCSLAKNSVANIQTYVSNEQLFLENSEAIGVEVSKFKNKATEIAKPLNCFVF